MYGIRIDEETREFSVVDTREFGLLLPVAGDTANKANRRARRYERRDNRRTHKERMAMIQAGMDPSTVEDYKSKKLHEKYGYKGHKLDASSENAAGKRALAEHRMDLRSGDKRDYRSNRTKRVAIRKLR
jgi:hypothetical protein